VLSGQGLRDLVDAVVAGIDEHRFDVARGVTVHVREQLLISADGRIDEDNFVARCLRGGAGQAVVVAGDRLGRANFFFPCYSASS